jgi:hypothetical protein
MNQRVLVREEKYQTQTVTNIGYIITHQDPCIVFLMFFNIV